MRFRIGLGALAAVLGMLSGCDNMDQDTAAPKKLSEDFSKSFIQGCERSASKSACDCVLLELEKSLSDEEISSVNYGTMAREKLVEKIQAATQACKKS